MPTVQSRLTAQSKYLRKGSLLVTSEGKGTPQIAANNGNALDLSQMEYRFTIKANDESSPNNAAIHVYNLSPADIAAIRGEYDNVVVSVGYQLAQQGIIFKGSIKQFREGRENSTDSFLEILAADGDTGYNFGLCNTSLAAGSTAKDAIQTALTAMNLADGYTVKLSGYESIRGKVLFALGKDVIQNVARSNKSRWSIQNGKLQIVPMDSYIPGTAVVLNYQSGLIGVPELTDEGLRCRCLIDPMLSVGGLIRLNNADINKLTQAQPNAPDGNLAYNQYQIQANSVASADGTYRVYVIEYSGTTRGDDWYADIIGLAVNTTNNTVKPYG